MLRRNLKSIYEYGVFDTNVRRSRTISENVNFFSEFIFRHASESVLTQNVKIISENKRSATLKFGLSNIFADRYNVYLYII